MCTLKRSEISKACVDTGAGNTAFTENVFNWPASSKFLSRGKTGPVLFKNTFPSGSPGRGGRTLQIQPDFRGATKHGQTSLIPRCSDLTGEVASWVRDRTLIYPGWYGCKDQCQASTLTGTWLPDAIMFRPESELSSFLFGPVTQHLTPISAFCLTTLTPRKSASVALLEGSNSLCRFLAKGDARKWYRVSETRHDASSRCWSGGKCMALHSPGKCHFLPLLKPAGGFGERAGACLLARRCSSSPLPVGLVFSSAGGEVVVGHVLELTPLHS